MNVIQDCNKDGKIDWKDFLFYGLSVAGNVLFTVLNIIH